MTTPTSAAAEETRLDFPVKGMHCAACVGKVERALLAVPGVETAAVNLATERATIRLGAGRPSLDALRRAVAAAGYFVPADIAATPEAADREQAERTRENRRLRLKVVAGAALSVPVLLGSMHEVFSWAPHWLRDPFLLWALTTPVQFWVGWQFHAGFVAELRHRSVSMNTPGQSVTATLKKYAALVPMETRVFMLAERWRSSLRKPAWNCQPTQN